MSLVCVSFNFRSWFHNDVSQDWNRLMWRLRLLVESMLILVVINILCLRVDYVLCTSGVDLLLWCVIGCFVTMIVWWCDKEHMNWRNKASIYTMTWLKSGRIFSIYSRRCEDQNVDRRSRPEVKTRGQDQANMLEEDLG